MITQVANPSSVPSAVADYEAQNAHISAFNNLANNQAFILTNSGGMGLPAIKLGTYIQYGGNLYVVDTANYAITGTPVDGNNYIRISGSTTLTAEWVQNISSYVWNEVYGYKYTGSYALLPYLVVKDGTEYEKYSMALDASFGKLKATTLDTGQGANKLYAMDQNVRTVDNVTFSRLGITQSTPREITFNGSTTGVTDDINLGELVRITFQGWSGSTSQRVCILPSGYLFCVALRTGMDGAVLYTGVKTGGETIATVEAGLTGVYGVLMVWRVA